jgi:glycosyltransferase involved in cell wall biosynthesis
MSRALQIPRGIEAGPAPQAGGGSGAKSLLFLKTCNQHPFEQSLMAELFTSCLPEHGYLTRFLQLADCDEEHPRAERIGSVTVLNCRVMRRGRGAARVVAGIVNRAAYACEFAREIRRERPAVIQVRQYTFGLFLAVAARKFLQIPVCYHEVFPFRLILQDRFERRRGVRARLRCWAGSAEEGLKRRLLRHVDLVQVISDAMRLQFLEELGDSGDSVCVLPLGVDMDATPFCVDPSERQPRDGQVRVVYLGTLDPLRQPEIMLEAAEWVFARCPTVSFSFIGGAPEHVSALRERAARLSCGVVCAFSGQLPRTEALRLASEGDIGLSLIPPTPMFAISSPTKLLEMMGLGLPVVATRGIPEHETLLNASGGGMLVSLAADEIGAAILRLAQDRDLRMKMGRGGRTYVTNNRNYRSMAAAVSGYYQRLGSNDVNSR